MPDSDLTSYISINTAQRLAALAGPATAPAVESFPAAVVFADISGFTALTERLSARGPEGLERLTELLNDAFGRLIDAVAAHGGDVVKFAGDSLIAIWRARNRSELSAVTLLAAQCALAMQAAFAALTASGPAALALRVQIGAGATKLLYVGGFNGRWETMVIGDTLLQVNLVGPQTNPGEVVVSPEAWELIHEVASGERLRAQTVRLAAVSQALPLHPLEVPALDAAALQPFLPDAVRSRLQAGQTDWLAELRRVSVVFINLPELSFATTLDQAHRVVQALQSEIYRYEGTIDKLSVDDKGVSMLAAFGLPPLAHEDDAVRALQAALSIQDRLQGLGLSSAIGIASGAVFCGQIGNRIRREYTMIGDVVNVAARLMEHAIETILCEEATMHAAGPRIQCEPLPPLQVKGKDQPIAVFRPQGSLTALEHHAALGGVVGRHEERALLGERLAALGAGRGGVVVIEGEAGLGKSMLVGEAVAQARKARMQVLMGAGSALDHHAPFHGLRPLLAYLLRLPPSDGPCDCSERREQIRRALAPTPELLAYAPLLNVIVGADMADTPTTAKLHDAARAAATSDLLIRMIAGAVSNRPTMLVIEDAHWLDSASWAVVRAVAERLPQVLLVLASRPIRPYTPPEYHELASDKATSMLSLAPLATDDALELVRRRLGVTRLDTRLADLIQTKAEGHPFWSEEIAYALRDAGMLEISDDTARLQAADEGLELAFPETIQGVITSRIDRLSPQQQLTLKVASVIGRVFAYRTISDVYPLEGDRPRLLDYLASLDTLDLTPRAVAEPQLTYAFKHALTQDVAYNLMLYAQRRQLHRAVAEWYERVHGADLRPYYAVLVHHWSHAIDPDDADRRPLARALEVLELASQESLKLGAYREASLFCERALDLLAGYPAMQRDAIAFALRLGEIRWRTGDYPAAEDHGERAHQLASAAGERALAADALRMLGNVAFLRGDLESALSLFQESAAEARAVEHMTGLTRAVSNIGVVAMRRGLYEAARSAYTEALGISKRHNDTFSMAINILNLGTIGLKMGEADESRRLLREALVVAREHQFVLVLLNVVLQFAALAQLEGRYRDGARLLGLLSAHPARDSELVAQISEIEPTFAATLGPEYAPLAASGAELELLAIADELHTAG